MIDPTRIPQVLPNLFKCLDNSSASCSVMSTEQHVLYAVTRLPSGVDRDVDWRAHDTTSASGLPRSNVGRVAIAESESVRIAFRIASPRHIHLKQLELATTIHQHHLYHSA